VWERALACARPVASSPRPAPEVGAVIDGKYELLERLGGGGMGTVFRARHALLGEEVALKLIHPAMASSHVARARFLREARAAMRIAHANVIQLREYGMSPDGDLYMSLELSRGVTLRQLLADRVQLPEAEAVRLARQLLLGLEAAHAQGVLHRDVKPENVLVEEDAQGLPVARLCDFGMAKLTGDGDGGQPDLTGEAIVGTPYYMAPEQFVPGGQVDARADLYALGCILYELLTGRRVFRAPTAAGIASQHLCRAPEPPSAFASVSRGLEALLLRTLEKDAAARPQSARELREALEAVDATAPRPRLRALVVEDSVVNGLLAARMLEKLGHEVLRVATAAEALERAPVVDVALVAGQLAHGDAGALVRGLRARATRRLGIVVISSDDRALDADARITRPFRSEALAEAVERAARPVAPPRLAEAHTPGDVFDLDAALSRMRGDLELLRGVVEAFVQSIPATLRDAWAALAAGDWGALARVMHGVRGAAASCALGEVTRCASRVEELARRRAAEAGDALEAFEASLARAGRALDEVAGATVG
jgi:CheY-like chemotaxis protein/HPt (histidine-containing phosphotransfer) domain-containing protein